MKKLLLNFSKIINQLINLLLHIFPETNFVKKQKALAVDSTFYTKQETEMPKEISDESLEKTVYDKL